MGIVTVGLSEFLESKAQNLVTKIEWMKDRDLKYLKNIQELSDFIDQAIGRGICALDLETTGLSTRKKNGVPVNKIVGFSISYDPKLGVYIPINHQEDPELNLPETAVLAEIKRLCDHCICIFHNSKFDGAFLENYGIIIKDFKKFEDTLLLARLYDAGQKEIGLKYLSNKLLGQPMIEFEDIMGKKNKRFDFISPKVGYAYACCDAICTLQLYYFFIENPIINSQMGIYNLEKRVVIVVREMESNYVKIDIEYLKKLRAVVEVRIDELKKEVHQLVGRTFNMASPTQLGPILFEELGYEYPWKNTDGQELRTKSGQYQTDTATLERIADRYPVAKKLVEYRGLEKTHGTYICNLLANYDENGCIKLSFNTVGTDTGRFSSPGGEGLDVDGYCGMNIQSIPANYVEGSPDIRKAFIARPGYKMVAIDYSGEELRIATNLSQEPKWLEEFLNGTGDLHTKTGQIVFRKQDISKAERQISKTLNFLTLYGGGPRGLAQQAKIAEKEAKRILYSFFEGLPTLKKWIDKERLKARKLKYAKTAMGRVRPLQMFYDSGDRGLEAHGDRCAVNFLVQGSGADIMKTALVKVYNWIHSNNLQDDIKILITMHDEIVFEMKENKLSDYIPKIAELMRMSEILQDKLKWPVSLEVDAEYGDSWHVNHDFFKEQTNRYAIVVKNASKDSENPPAPTTPLESVIEISPQASIEETPASVVVPSATLEAPSASVPVKDDLSTFLNEIKAKEASDAHEKPLEVGDNTLKTLGTDSSVAVVSIKPQEVTVGENLLPNVNNGLFVYRIERVTRGVYRRLNLIIEFMREEIQKNKGYTGSKKKLVLVDAENNSLLVEDIYVYPDAFLSIARYLNV